MGIALYEFIAIEATGRVHDTSGSPPSRPGSKSLDPGCSYPARRASGKRLIGGLGNRLKSELARPYYGVTVAVYRPNGVSLGSL